MLAALYAVSFVAAFNENIVNVALIDIMDAFGVTALTAQWLVTGYMMVATLIVTLSAFLYRCLGVRLLFIVASAFLIVGSIGAIVSTTFWMLLVFRPIQSVGTVVFIPTMMSTVLAVAPRAKLGTYPSVGGRIMDKHGPWPLLFLGFATIAVGQVTICFSASQVSWVGVLIASVVVYSGVGLVLSPSQTTGLATLTGDHHPHGVALINTAIQLAASIGPSLLIGIMSGVGSSEVTGFIVAIGVAGAIAVIGALVALVYTRRLARKHEVAEATEARPTISTIMVPDAYSVPDIATVRDVAKELVGYKTSGLPIVDNAGAVAGYITDGDILCAVSAHAEPGMDVVYYLSTYAEDKVFDQRIEEIFGLGALEIATASVITFDIATPLEEAAEVMDTKRLKKVPVVENGALVGVLTRSGIVRQLLGPFTVKAS